MGKTLNLTITHLEQVIHKKISVIIPTMDRRAEVLLCLDSVLRSEYTDYEVLVIDNASTDGTAQALGQKYAQEEKVRLIRSEKNLGAGGGRNLGAHEAKGEYLLFLDSDNVIDPKMLGHLANFLGEHDECIMVGPLMLIQKNPDLIWLSFADIDLRTSQAHYRGFGEKNEKQYPEIIPVGHLPNCFMVRKAEFEAVGGFDEKYFIMFEEADLAERLKKQFQKKVFLLTAAVTYHDFPLEDNIVMKNLGLRSAKRAYLTARNRVYFMRKNASTPNLVLFLLIFNPASLAFYEFNLLKNKQFKLAGAYLWGFLAGYFM